MNESSSYEGLNLPELLERMHDLAMPEPIALLPQTDGWWVLIGWLVGLGLIGALKLSARRRRNRYRREALAKLHRLVRDNASRAEASAAVRVAELVKRTALSAYPRTEVASLYGDDWADFLVRTSGGDPLITSAATRLARAAYAPDIQLEEIAAGAERWIRRHHA